MPGGDNVIPFPGGVSRDEALRPGTHPCPVRSWPGAPVADALPALSRSTVPSACIHGQLGVELVDDLEFLVHGGVQVA